MAPLLEFIVFAGNEECSGDPTLFQALVTRTKYADIVSTMGQVLTAKR
jgi:hypothetical protein